MKKSLVRSQVTNLTTTRMYRREMLNLAQNVFEFIDMPEYIDIAYLNRTLLFNGSIAFFYDDVLKSVIALPYDVLGNLDIYGRPQTIMARSANGKYYRRLNSGEFVIMYDNNGRYPLFEDIVQMSERIAMCVRTQDVNLVQQRTPRIWKTNKDKEYTVKNMINEIDGMMENVVTYDSIDIDDIGAVVAPAPYVTDKIDLHLDKLWAEFYRLIGVANLQEQKRERVIVDEMTASQGGTIASRYSRFEPRAKAVKEINNKWGLNIEVRYYDGEPSTVKEDDNYVLSNDLSLDSNGLQSTTGTV